MEKYPHILSVYRKDVFEDMKLVGKAVVQEKIDGANFRFRFEDGSIKFGTRNIEFPASLSGQYGDACFYLTEKFKDELVKKYNKYTFYGELCIQHTLVYDFANMPLFIGFDIKDPSGKFIPYPQNKEIFAEFNIAFVPVVLETEVTKENRDNFFIHLETLIPESKYGHFLAEGVVVKFYDNDEIVKYVREEFKEENAAVFGGHLNDGEHKEFIPEHQYVTNRRIKKVIEHLLDEGEKLEMELMPKLIKYVLKDIVEECAYDIFTSSYTINFKNLRKYIGLRCRTLLKLQVEQYYILKNQKHGEK